MPWVDESRLDDPEAMRALDSRDSLRSLASAGAQVRRAIVSAQEAGVDRAAVLAPAREGEVPRSALDASRAAMQLGWKPWTDLAAGSAAVLDYFRTRG